MPPSVWSRALASKAGAQAFDSMDFEVALDKAWAELRSLVITKHNHAIAEREATHRAECAWLQKEIEQLRSGLPHGDEKPLIFEIPSGPMNPSPEPPMTTPEYGHGGHDYRASSQPAPQLDKIEINVANVGHARSGGTDYEVLVDTGEKPPDAPKELGPMQSTVSAQAQPISSSRKQLGQVVKQAHRRSQEAHIAPKIVWNGEAFVENVLSPVMCGIILLNSVKLGIELDYGEGWYGWTVLDRAFLIIYVLEICTKLFIMRPRQFFFGPARYWNLFDMVVVLLSGADFVLAIVGSSTETSNYLILIRLVRLGRVARILKVFQFKMFKELLTMLNGLVSGLRTLVWAFVLLFFPVYFLGFLLTIFVGKEAAEGSLEKESFGTLAASMFMVFRCTVGDCSYSNGTPAIMGLVQNQGEFCAIIYIFCVMVTEFGIFNLIMATFVDNALATAKKDEARRVQARLANVEFGEEKSADLVERLWILCDDTDVKHDFDPEKAIDMSISKDQFDTVIKDELVQTILEDLDVPEDDRSGLFEVLDADGGGSLTLEELISGIMHLRGDPRRSDVIHVSLVMRSLQEDLSKFKHMVDKSFTRIGDSLFAVSKRMDYVSPPALPKLPTPALMQTWPVGAATR